MANWDLTPDTADTRPSRSDPTWGMSDAERDAIIAARSQRTVTCPRCESPADRDGYCACHGFAA